MGTIHVCDLESVAAVTAEVGPSHVVSLVRHGMTPDTPPGVARERHLRLDIDDITGPLDGAIAPTRRDVEALVDFVGSWSGDRPLVVHCAAGVSRSMAAALVIAAAHTGRVDENFALRLREAAPHASPNPLIVSLADEVLRCDGRLVEAFEAMGPPDIAAVPRPISVSTA